MCTRSHGDTRCNEVGDMAKTVEYGLGEYTFPRGWFMVAEAVEVTDKPLAVRYFGRDLVLYRGRASGRVALLDAYCPHMGTHLGINTTSYVVRDGQHIEDDSVWHDEEGLAPEWAAPELAEWHNPAWVHWKMDHLGTLPIHGQEIVDNIADMAHFGPIHGTTVEFFENEFAGHRAIQRMIGPHRTLVDAADKLHTDTTYHGPGFLLSHMKGRYPSIIFIANTPVDDGVSRAWHALLVKSPHKVAGEEDAIAARAFQEASRLAFAQDFEAWAHKRPALTIMQVNADGPFHLERTWYRQFYNPRARRGEFLKRCEGVHRMKGMAPVSAATG
jgi:3-ketosteroid 9alpha-monooxygenase subunit A